MQLFSCATFINFRFKKWWQYRLFALLRRDKLFSLYFQAKESMCCGICDGLSIKFEKCEMQCIQNQLKITAVCVNNLMNMIWILLITSICEIWAKFRRIIRIYILSTSYANLHRKSCRVNNRSLFKNNTVLPWLIFLFYIRIRIDYYFPIF